ncbi:hypothetical protein HYH03_007631 [Edaphochlamys debaryana]|uniref:Uncharacterized protein n=1 Tax=Edaphochlamys debaryana TaxID=47281 RepID=A0A836C0A3_9CHLO|nr:hypothetical protein HYH03_007631 [Edaphochlamys debaryana]|eukprot:KAG2494278.1 hypothetical protein HYH03_007631 [Edaphochlamys debaryana]
MTTGSEPSGARAGANLRGADAEPPTSRPRTSLDVPVLSSGATKLLAVGATGGVGAAGGGLPQRPVEVFPPSRGRHTTYATFSGKELEALVSGLERYGTDWAAILESKPVLHGRSEASLSAKYYRLIAAAGSGRPDAGPQHLRTRIEALAVAERAKSKDMYPGQRAGSLGPAPVPVYGPGPIKQTGSATPPAPELLAPVLQEARPAQVPYDSDSAAAARLAALLAASDPTRAQAAPAPKPAPPAPKLTAPAAMGAGAAGEPAGGEAAEAPAGAGAVGMGTAAEEP